MKNTFENTVARFRKASVVVKRIPEDAELAALRSEAEALVEETED